MAFLVRMAFHGFRHFAAAGLGLLMLLPLPALRCALIAKKGSSAFISRIQSSERA